ncbi:hypothetical protein CALCODRAFT_107435 [Calocera cornea HHB12733]|uniref:BRCT domain-containing protein n=1 Tax=Calocera cornea HHB12733 TaxID=1353952 RepID=A0A165IG77_9BASI|nr:hypothetical protein CALCODRAFT_107435 [Calocera cornea HHB12733]
MTSATNSLFVLPNGLPIYFFIEPNEIPQSTRQNLTRSIELYGGGICVNASQAHIILVVRGTGEAEKYANLWTHPPESKPVLDYLWIKTCIGKGGLLLAEHNWDGLLVPHDDAESSDLPAQNTLTPSSSSDVLSDGTIDPSMIAGNGSTEALSAHYSSSSAMPHSSSGNSPSVNGNHSNGGSDVFRSMTAGFPSQSALNHTSSMAMFPNAFQFPSHLVQNSIPVVFIQPQMLAQLPFLYNGGAGLDQLHSHGVSQAPTAASSSTMVANERQSSVTESGSSPSSQSIPTRKEFAASQKSVPSARSSRALSTAVDASSSSKRVVPRSSGKGSGSTTTRERMGRKTPAPVTSRSRQKRPIPHGRSQSPPSERRRGLRSAAAEPAKFFVTHDGDALRFYIPMDVENHMEILENIRTHGGRGTPIGYSDYVIMESPSTFKALPQIRQLGVPGIKPGWVDACIEAEELLPIDAWEVHDEADLLPQPLEAEQRRDSRGDDATSQAPHKRRREDKKNGSPVKAKHPDSKHPDSLSQLTPGQRAALPAGPKVLVRHAGGYRFTHEDSQVGRPRCSQILVNHRAVPD